MKHALIITLALALTACGGSRRVANFANTPDVRSGDVCQADSSNNVNCVSSVNTQKKYDRCIVDHNGDVDYCDMIFQRGAYGLLGRGNRLVTIAPPGPNVWGNGASAIQAGYGWEAANAQSQAQGSSDGSSVPRKEYEADKEKTTSRFKGLYNQTAINKKRIDDLEGEKEGGK